MKKIITLLACLSAISWVNAQVPANTPVPLTKTQSTKAGMPKGLDAPVQFPVVTKGLSPKAFESYPNPAANNGGEMSAPICVIGHDPLSISWLNEKKDALVDANAMCFVVNVETEAAFNQLQSIAPKLRLAPLSANWLGTLLKVEHYPALITAQWIAQ